MFAIINFATDSSITKEPQVTLQNKIRIASVSLILCAASRLPGQQNAAMPGAFRIIANGHTQSITTEDLKALPHHTVTVHNPHTSADETYTGVPLMDLLAKEGVPHGHDLRGKALSDYIVATGSDGYKAVLALAEVDPDFHPGEVLVASQMDGKPLDARTGPFRLIVTEDKRPARSVRNLVSIEVESAK